MQNGQKITTFQKRFVSLTDESDKTLSELAKDLHVSNQTVSAWKTGVRSPKEPTIITIANYFGVDVCWLMGFDVAKDAKPSVAPLFTDSSLLSELLVKMSPEDYKMVIDAFNRTYKRMKEDGVSL